MSRAEDLTREVSGSIWRASLNGEICATVGNRVRFYLLHRSFTVMGLVELIIVRLYQ